MSAFDNDSQVPTEQMAKSVITRREFVRRGGAFAGALGLPLVLGQRTVDRSATGGRASTTSKSIGKGKTIGVSCNGTADYSKNLCTGVAEALVGTGYGLHIVQASLSTTTEISNIESLVNEGVVGIVAEPVSIASAGEGAQYARKHKVPITNALWSGATSEDKYYLAVADVDSVLGGRIIGDWIKKNTQPASVCVIQGVLGQGFSEGLSLGLDEALKGSKWKVAVQEQGNFDPVTAVGIVRSALIAHPDIKIIVDYAAVMGDAIAGYLSGRKQTNLTHITSDGDQSTLHWISTPYCTANRYYSAAQTGYVCTMAIRQKLETGSAGPFKRSISQIMMTKQNEPATLKADPMYYSSMFAAVAKAGF